LASSSDFPNRIPNSSNQIGQTRFLKSYVKVARKLLESDGKVLGTEGAVNFYSTSARPILFHNFSQNFGYNNSAPKLAYKWSETGELIKLYCSLPVPHQFYDSSRLLPGHYHGAKLDPKKLYVQKKSARVSFIIMPAKISNTIWRRVFWRQNSIT